MRVQPTSIVEEGAQIGEGTVVWDWCKVRHGAIIGKDCVIGDYVEIGPGVVIANGTHVGAGAQVHHPARIGSNVFIAPRAFLSNDKYPSLEAEFVPQGVTIYDDVIVGAGAIIIGGVTIHEGAFIAAAACVTKDVAAGAMVRGVPAHAYGARAMHYPGTAVQHWGPLDPHQNCTNCRDRGLDQYHLVMAGKEADTCSD